MGLFSFFRKNKQETAAADDGGYYSRSDEESAALRARSKRASIAGEPAARGKQAREAADPVLPEKKRARRRLVGAIALALGVAIGLPMVLDSEPKPLASDIAIQIPSKDKLPAPAASKVSASETLDKNEEIVDTAAKEAPETPTPGAAAPVNPPVIAELKTLGEAPPKPQRDVRPEVKPEVKPTPKLATKPAPKAEEKKIAIAEPAKPAKPPTPKHSDPGEAERALSILEGAGAAKPAASDAPPSSFVLQVAALATQDKVDELQARLKQAGINSFTQKVPGKAGARIRIRVGPFGSKDEAEKMRIRLTTLGLNGALVPA